MTLRKVTVVATLAFGLFGSFGMNGRLRAQDTPPLTAPPVGSIPEESLPPVGIPSSTLQERERLDEIPLGRKEFRLPNVPKQPRNIPQKQPKYVPHCERYFLYKGVRQEVDSDLGRDGSRLKEAVEDVPESLREIEKYQNLRGRIKTAAFVGSGAGLVALTGLIVGFSNTFIVSGRSLFLIGAATAVGSFIYSIGQLHSNESHLEKAVQYHNVEHPEQPVDLLFSTGFHF